MVLVGFPSNEETTFDFISLLQKEIDIISIYRYRNVFPSAVQILTEYSKTARAIITHKFDLEDMKDAMEQSFTSPGVTGKVIIYPHGY